MAAVNKAELGFESNSKLLHEYQTIEGQINAELKENYPTSEYVTISAHNISRPVRERIIREFRAAGWKVELVSDHRDGDFLKFA